MLGRLSGWVLIAVAAALGTSATVNADRLTVVREVDLKSAGHVSGQKICLQDLVDDAVIGNRCALDRTMCCKWDLGGQREVSISKAEIQREVARMNFGGFQIEFKGAETIFVAQTQRELTVSEIETKLREVSAAQLGEAAKNLSIISVKAATPVYVGIDQQDWTLILPEVLSETTMIKVVEPGVNHALIGWVQANLRLEREVYVAKKTIRPTDAIRLEDFDLAKVNLLSKNRSESETFNAQEFPAGMRARLSILAGSPLVMSALEKVPMVRLGDSVTLVLRADNLKISTKGIVQGSAAVGDMVSVSVSRYNRTFRGRLVEGRLVEVWL